MKKVIALVAVATAAWAAPALANDGSTTPTRSDHGRHCGLTRGHHNGWRHHAKSHKAGRGCPAHKTSETTGSSTDEQKSGDDQKPAGSSTCTHHSDTQGSSDDNDQGEDNDAQGEDRDDD